MTEADEQGQMTPRITVRDHADMPILLAALTEAALSIGTKLERLQADRIFLQIHSPDRVNDLYVTIKEWEEGTKVLAECNDLLRHVMKLHAEHHDREGSRDELRDMGMYL